MQTKLQDCLFRLILISSFLLQYLQGVTVKPSLCPTNKIAPHKRVESWNQRQRTFGSFYELFSNQNDDPSSLQEPLEDDGDCGDKDYDEYDLSSLTQSNRRQSENRFFFGGLFNSRPDSQPSFPNRPQNPHRPEESFQPSVPQRPQQPVRPGQSRPPTRPPYWSGGHFGNNPFRPPVSQYPSNSIKPVYEDTPHEDQVTYKPGVVGGPLGHIVGVPQRPARPTTEPSSPSTNRRPVYSPYNKRTTRRPRKLNSDTVLGSFIDLLF